MGKNWKGGKQGGGGNNDFSSCRGFGVVIGTCDAARERETSKELINLLNEAIEEVYPDQVARPVYKKKEDEEEEPQPETDKPSSIEQLLKQELEDVRQKKNSGSQNVISINTGVKGITMIKINRKEFSPLKLVKAIFERVKREKLALSRHIVRMIPLDTIFFPNEEELRDNLRKVIEAGLIADGVIAPDAKLPIAASTSTTANSAKENSREGDASAEEPNAKRQKVEEKEEKESSEEAVEKESDATTSAPEPPVPTPAPENLLGTKFPYMVHFKARNHDVLTKDLTVSVSMEHLRPYAYGDYRTPQVVLMVEALKNLGGITWLRNCDCYMDFNIRRFQAEHAKSDV